MKKDQMDSGISRTGSWQGQILLVCLMMLLVGLAVDLDAEDHGLVRSGSVTTGPALDYQSSIIRVAGSDQLLLVFERIDPVSFFGDLLMTSSVDEGFSWTEPQLAVGTVLNERHPALVQLGPSSFALFYLVDESGSGSYRIHRASSPDGSTWTEHGAIDLGWTSTGEVNPAVVHDGANTLTMSYQRSGAFIARSIDGGVSWDGLKTQVSTSWAALPRLSYRPSDGVYLVTYQVNPSGNNDLDIVAKTSDDPYDWNSPEIPISSDVNSHDSRPMVLRGGGFAVSYVREVASVFDVFYRTSCDGVIWGEQVRITSDELHYDTQPHLLDHLDPSKVILTWSHQMSAQPYQDHDVLIETDLRLVGPIFCDGFEAGNTDAWSLPK